MARAVTGWAPGKGEAGTRVLGKKEVETGRGQLGLRRGGHQAKEG